MIVCWRTVRVPADQRVAFLDWIEENAAVRRAHGILFEHVLDVAAQQNPTTTLRPDLGDHDPDELVVVTGWPDHATFDAWIRTPDRDRLTASAVHAAVEYRPLTRYDVIGGYPLDRPEHRPGGTR
jgi:heme-degrading monooxygenase HmoA